MPNNFVEGNTYTNSPTAYGLRPYDEQKNTEATSIPDATYLCVGVTNSSVTMKRTQPTGAGPTANPGVLLGTTQRLRIERDATGLMAFPMGRSYGRPVLRPSPPPDTFWSANTCPFDGNTISVASLNAFAVNGLKTRTGSASIWNFTSGVPYLTLTPSYSGAMVEGVFTLYACIGNATGAAVTPKLICQATSNSATVNTGTITLEWNGRIVRTSVAGVLDLTTVGAFPAPTPLPDGMASVSTIVIRAVNYNLISGSLVFGMSL